MTKAKAVSGGIIYLGVASTSTQFDLQNSYFKDLYTSYRGGMMYMEGDSSPTVSFNILKCQFECQKFDLWYPGKFT